VLFGIYMILAGVERFFIELIRVNTKYHVAGISFTQAEMISLIMVIGGALLIVNGLKNKKTATLQHG
jgi:prolipoprotein diacylglyceryltransferase